MTHNFSGANVMQIYKTKIATICHPNDCDFYFVPLTDEILNLWNDFLEIVDYQQSTPQISKIIESI